MNEPRLDAGTAEGMLRGESTGPPELAELLAAAASGLAAEDGNGEEAAVAAFRRTRSIHSTRPSTRRLSASVGLKAALIGFVLVLAGGVTAVTTSQHLPGPLDTRHSPSTRTPTPPRKLVSRTPPPAPSRPTSGRTAEPTPHATRTHAAHPQKTARPKEHPHPTKKPKGKATKSKAPHRTTGPVPRSEHLNAEVTGL
jgi:hypothetical protein